MDVLLVISIAVEVGILVRVPAMLPGESMPSLVRDEPRAPGSQGEGWSS